MILRAAKRRKGLILFEDEASFAQWGSLRYTWARRGQQPEVKTSSPAFVRTILAHTTAPLVRIHDGARYHTSLATTQFLAQHADRLTVHPLPSYSPDYNPMEYLWKKTKKRATHNQYCKEFTLRRAMRTTCRKSATKPVWSPNDQKSRCQPS